MRNEADLNKLKKEILGELDKRLAEIREIKRDLADLKSEIEKSTVESIRKSIGVGLVAIGFSMWLFAIGLWLQLTRDFITQNFSIVTFLILGTVYVVVGLKFYKPQRENLRLESS